MNTHLTERINKLNEDVVSRIDIEPNSIGCTKYMHGANNTIGTIFNMLTDEERYPVYMSMMFDALTKVYPNNISTIREYDSSSPSSEYRLIGFISTANSCVYGVFINDEGHFFMAQAVLFKKSDIDYMVFLKAQPYEAFIEDKLVEDYINEVLSAMCLQDMKNLRQKCRNYNSRIERAEARHLQMYGSKISFRCNWLMNCIVIGRHDSKG